MEVPQTIKREKVDDFTPEPDVNCKTNILDSVEIKLEPIKLEQHLYAPEPNKLDQKFNLTKEAKIMIGNNDKCMLNEISNQKSLEIKLEGNEEMVDIVDVKWETENKELDIKDEMTTEDKEERLIQIFSKQKVSEIELDRSKAITEAEKMDDSVDVKWAMVNDELNIKQEENIDDEEHGKAATFVSRQQQHKTHAASGSKQKIGGDNLRCKQCKSFEKKILKEQVVMYKCDQCNYQTVHRGYLKTHILNHKKADKVDIYKCDQCDFHAIQKRSLKYHSLKHKHSDKVDIFKCYECNYQTVRKQNFKRHSLRHKNSDQVEMYKCDQCEFETAHKTYFKTHSLKHKNSDEADMYKCDQCEFKTVHKGSLKTHSLKHKNPDEVNMYVCDQCKYLTHCKRNLKRHSLIHKNFDEVDAYKCDQCDYQTNHKRYLKTHSLKHINPDEINMYLCNQCKYQTTGKSTLKQHSLIHKILTKLIRTNVTNVITKQL